MIPENFISTVAAGHVNAKRAAHEYRVPIGVVYATARNAGVPFRTARRQAVLRAILTGVNTSKLLAERFKTSPNAMCVTLHNMESDGFIKRCGHIANKCGPSCIRWRVAGFAP